MNCPNGSFDFWSAPRRIAGGLIGWLGLLCLATASTWSLEFPPLGEAGVADAVCGFGVDGGRVISVVLPGQQAVAARLAGGGKALPLLGHDPVSRLAVLDGAGVSGSAGSFPLGSSAGLEAGAVIRLEGAAGARVAGWVRRFGGRVLPVSLLQLNYPGKVPAAGTPLLDGKGRVVAIGYQADPTRAKVGYALPIEVYLRAAADLDRNGGVVRTWLGVTLRDGVGAPVLVRVEDGSPAARGGLRAGDVLLQVGGNDVGSYAEAVNSFYYLVAGQSVKWRILRGVEELVVEPVPLAAARRALR